MLAVFVGSVNFYFDLALLSCGMLIRRPVRTSRGTRHNKHKSGETLAERERETNKASLCAAGRSSDTCCQGEADGVQSVR